MERKKAEALEEVRRLQEKVARMQRIKDARAAGMTEWEIANIARAPPPPGPPPPDDTP